VEAQAVESKNVLERLRTYRADQGRYVRLATFWSLVALWFYGTYRFYEVLVNLKWGWAQFLQVRLVEEMPLLEWPLTPAALVALAVFLGGAAGLQLWLNRPQVADTLIETEAELRKVTWPTARDTVNASVVVIIAVVVIFLMLGAFDFVLAQTVERILFSH
jgi:preprotein translocase SecE subunit